MATKKKSKTSATGRREVQSVSELVLDLCLFTFTVGLLFLLKVQILPVMSPVTFTVKGQEDRTHILPYFLDSFSDEFDASLEMIVPQFHASVFSVQVDDCIQSLRINGKPMIPEYYPVVCSPHEFTRMDLGPYLRTGKNTLHFRISDIGVTGGMNIMTSNTDPFLLLLQIASFLCITWFVFRLRSYLPVQKRPPRWIVFLFLAAILLRVLYAGATSYHLRAHDTEGHVEYLQYMADNGTIPNAADGWEFHQPPVYYASMGLFRRAALAVGLSDSQVLQVLSGFSVGLSVLSVFLFLLIAGLVFQPKERWSLFGYGAIVSSACGLLLLTPNITNEVFAIPLVLFLLYLILRWWMHEGAAPIWLLALIFSLAFLNKISAILMLPVLLSCFILHPTLSQRKRIASIVLFSAITVCLAGWYPVYRLFLEPSHEKTVSLGNDGMDPGLIVPRDAKHLLTFNPVQILRHPYNDPWDDEKRRGYFAEYFFRSAFFGEFTFEHMKPLSYAILALALLLFVPFALGVVSSFRRTFVELWPLHMTTICLFAGACLYPYFFPFSPNQDFRFSVVLTAPVAYYIVRGIGCMPRIFRLVFAVLLGAFVLLCTVFYGSLFFFS